MKKPHWTQTPDGKARLAKAMKQSWKGRRLSPHRIQMEKAATRYTTAIAALRGDATPTNGMQATVQIVVAVNGREWMLSASEARALHNALTPFASV